MMRLLVSLHRWIGVALCLLFATWFATGIVMIYVKFPSLPAGERIEHAAPLNLSSGLNLSSVLVASGVRSPSRIRLVSFQQRPLLVVEDANGTVEANFADNAELAPSLSQEDAAAIALDFSNTAIREVSDLIEYDQWIVHQQFDRYRPFYRVALEDAANTHLYVSAVSGDVMQRTNAHQRAWNYVGAVIHWIYPTFIRKNWALWDQLVWWLSLIGIIGVIAGIVLGVKRLQDALRRGHSGLASPFQGWMRWHHQTGIIASAVVLAWIFSGWLSMDHDRLFSMPDPTADQIAQFQGISLTESISRITPELLEGLEDAKEIEISAINGEALMVVKAVGSTSLLTIDESGSVTEGLDETTARSAISKAWPDNQINESFVVPSGDTYIDLREGSLGNNILRGVLDDEDKTWVHVDMNEGRIASVMDSSRRSYRWFYNGLHSLDIPGLVNRRPLWDIVIITLMLGGFAFSITGAVLAYRRLRLTF